MVMDKEKALKVYGDRLGEQRTVSEEAGYALAALKESVNRDRSARGAGLPTAFRVEAGRFIRWCDGLPDGLALSGRRARALLERYGVTASG
jgi:hypothetical protein